MTEEDIERLRAENKRLENEFQAYIEHHLTDLGNAKRLVLRYGKELRFVHGWGWMHYDKIKWQEDKTGVVERAAKDTVLSLHYMALYMEDENKRQALVKHALRSESDAKIRAMISLAESEKGIVAVPSDFDCDLMLLNCLNGTVNLKTGELRQHNAEDMITKVVPVEFDSDAKCPTWRSFLNRVIPDQEVRGFLFRVIGYALTGSTREQCLFILFGTGANGKSVFVEIIRALMGEYAKVADVSTFLSKQGDRIPNDLAALAGARVVSAVEVESGRRLAEALVKQVTGGDVVTARFLHKEYFEFRPQFKLFLATNHKPVIYGTDHAIWRRLKLVPFNVTIPENEQDKELVEELKQELSGILTWAVQGCLNWQRIGLNEPAEVLQATDGYRNEMDVLGQFIEESCETGERHEVMAKRLYQEYLSWCEDSKEKNWSKKLFGTRMRERGFVSETRTNNILWWKSIRLKHLDEED